MREFNIKSGAEFDREAELTNKATRWFNPKYKGKSVDTDTLLSIKRKFNKSLDWLLFGEEPNILPQLAERRGETYEARPLAPLEANLLYEVRKKVEEVLKQERKTLQPEQHIRLLTKVYNDCAEERKQPDTDMISRYLWLFN
jgi:hypothetical protein